MRLSTVRKLPARGARGVEGWSEAGLTQLQCVRNIATIARVMRSPRLRRALCLLALPFAPLAAQVIAGQAMDPRIKKPVASVLDRLVADSSDIVLDSARTDASGKFHFGTRPVTTFRLEFSHGPDANSKTRAVSLAPEESWDPLIPLPADMPMVYAETEVTTPVLPLPNVDWPHFPDSLSRAGVSGFVLLAFVVDTLGRVEVETVQVLRMTHRGFLEAVVRFLPRARFMPAMINGEEARQLVHQPYEFNIAR